MIPFSDPSQPNRIFPFVNIGLIVVNFLVFFYELSLRTLTSRAAAATGGVAYWAHVGGFITGAILIWLFRKRTHVDQMRAFHARSPGH